MSKRYPPVVPLTFAGKLLVFVMQLVGKVIDLFYGKRYATPKPGFEENPRTYTASDILYFGYKYYYKPPEKAESPELQKRFLNARFAFPKPGDADPIYTISIGGDLMPYAWLTSRSCHHLWDQLGPWFFASDLVFANLETPIDLSKPPSAVPEVMLNNMYFNGSEELYAIFTGFGRYKGYDVLSTANNHSLDQGAEGVRATRNFLKSKGVKSCGTASQPGDSSIAYTQVGDIRIAFVAATNSLNQLSLKPDEEYLVNLGNYNTVDPDFTDLESMCKEARANADLVMLSLHTGNAYQAYPNAHTVANMEKLVERCQPDAILGSHPHNPQGVEQLSFTDQLGQEKRCLVIYSPGDFVAYDIFTWCHLHLSFRLKVSRINGSAAICGFEVLPTILSMEGKGEQAQFQFIPLLDEDQKKEVSSDRQAEWEELLRFWDSHLSPSLAPYVAQPFG